MAVQSSKTDKPLVALQEAAWAAFLGPMDKHLNRMVVEFFKKLSMKNRGGRSCSAVMVLPAWITIARTCLQDLHRTHCTDMVE